MLKAKYYERTIFIELSQFISNYKTSNLFLYSLHNFCLFFAFSSYPLPRKIDFEIFCHYQDANATR